MVSFATRAVKAYSRLVIKKDPTSSAQLVKHFRRALSSPLPPLLPRTVTRHSFQGNGIQGEWLRVKNPSMAVLYLHGGGYIAGNPRTYLTLCGAFAKELHADVFLPDYRLAPEHPFPAAVEDAVASYRLLLERFEPRQIAVVGDSAGGALSLATLLAARDAGLPMPRCAVAYSPFADMTAPAGSRQTNAHSCDMFTPNTYVVDLALYARTEEERRHPYASPVFGDYHGLPPLMVTVDEGECLRDDAYQVAARAQEAGVEVTFISREGLLHVWPVFYPLIPEAREDIKRTIRFIQDCAPPPDS